MADNENNDLNPEEEEVATAEEAETTEEEGSAETSDDAGPEADEVNEKPEADETKPTNGEIEDGNRRRLLIGAGIGAAAVAAAAYGASRLLEPPEATEVRSKFVAGQLPLNDPNSSTWKKAPLARVVMGPQVMALPTKDKPAVKDIRVRSLNNGDTIGFLLEWSDPNDSDTTIQTDKFRDACAVLFVTDPSLEILRVMGAATMPATIIQWKADWQVDVAKGYQDLDAVWPNASFDFYPPLTELPHEAAAENAKVVVPDDYVSAGATSRIAGYAVNNPVALMNRKTPVEKIIAQGPGTTATLDTQDATGWGSLKGGKWKVALGRSMKPTNEKEVPVPQTGEIGVAFAVWRGDENDRGARKTPSNKLLKLIVEGG